MSSSGLVLLTASKLTCECGRPALSQAAAMRFWVRISAWAIEWLLFELGLTSGMNDSHYIFTRLTTVIDSLWYVILPPTPTKKSQQSKKLQQMDLKLTLSDPAIVE